MFSWRNEENVHLLCITKTCLYNFDPLKPHFYIVKLGFTGVYIIFLISAQNHNGYSLELPQWGSSNEYSQSMFWAEIWKNTSFLSENFQVLGLKFSKNLNRHVFVMVWKSTSSEAVSAFPDTLTWSLHIYYQGKYVWKYDINKYDITFC